MIIYTWRSKIGLYPGQKMGSVPIFEGYYFRSQRLTAITSMPVITPKIGV